MQPQAGMRRIILLLALLALSGCALRRVWGNGPSGAGAATTDLVIIGTGTGPSLVVITVEPTTSGPLCAPDDPDPTHTCPDQSGPDPR
jgi:hypothetical protein